jgi:hypothetical protein
MWDNGNREWAARRPQEMYYGVCYRPSEWGMASTARKVELKRGQVVFVEAEERILRHGHSGDGSTGNLTSSVTNMRVGVQIHNNISTIHKHTRVAATVAETQLIRTHSQVTPGVVSVTVSLGVSAVHQISLSQSAVSSGGGLSLTYHHPASPELTETTSAILVPAGGGDTSTSSALLGGISGLMEVPKSSMVKAIMHETLVFNVDRHSVVGQVYDAWGRKGVVVAHDMSDLIERHRRMPLAGTRAALGLPGLFHPAEDSSDDEGDSDSSNDEGDSDGKAGTLKQDAMHG